MVSWIVSCIAICALASVGFSFPIIEEHQEIGIPETGPKEKRVKGGVLKKPQKGTVQLNLNFMTVERHESVVGHEEILGHEIGLSQDIHGLEPKHATSYQSFHLESKNAVPVVIKTIHPPTIKHFSGVGESFGHEIPEIEPIDLKLHGI